MKKKVLLIAHFCSDFDVNVNNRFNYLANLFSDNNYEVEFITSDFSHSKKKKRSRLVNDKHNYKITLIHEPIYSKNVSLKRFYSHYIMSKNLKKYLKNLEKPDVIYCAVPSLDVSEVVANYAKKNNIEFIIDVQDLWPEAFKMVFNIPIISDILFHPMKKKADYIYNSADSIVAVSKTYLERALSSNKKVSDGKVIFLGTDLDKFDYEFKINKYNNKPINEIWIAYIGTLGHSYDIKCVIDAINILEKQGFNNLKFIVMGDGPLKSEFESYAKSRKINVLFTGILPYNEMVGMLGVCDIAVNPIKKNSQGSIINKHGDYVAAGLPVVNTQECQEYRNLVEEYKMGLNCINGDFLDVSKKIKFLIENSHIRISMGRNARKLAEEKFNRVKTYQKILKLLY